MFTCQFGWYRISRLPFGVAPAGDIFQQKNDKVFKDLPNVFGIADGILIVGYYPDGGDHDITPTQVLQICQQENLKIKSYL